MPQISPESQRIIKEFLQTWWQSLAWQVRETALGVELPHLTADALYDNALGHTLRDLAAAGEGLLAADEFTRGVQQEGVQQICEWMWARPGQLNAYHIPEEFWSSPIGYIVLKAHLWARKETLLTPTEAEALCGKSTQQLRQMADRSKLTAYGDPNEPNPQRRTRYLKSEILSLKKKRRAK